MSRDEVLEFVRRHRFDGYQGLTLPHGFRVPGQDKSSTAAAVFPADLRGRTVLDVGCNYGFFCHEAARRGAERVVGIERDPDRCRIAAEVARLMDDGVEIRAGSVESLDTGGRFDIVLFLSVLHHITEPLPTLKRLAACCSGTVVVEFCLPSDPEYLCLLGRVQAGRSSLRERVLGRLRSLRVRLLGRGLPLVAIGSVPYHRTFYFSPTAFRHLFTLHHALFTHVTFRPSPTPHRVIAFCEVAERSGP